MSIHGDQQKKSILSKLFNNKANNKFATAAHTSGVGGAPSPSQSPGGAMNMTAMGGMGMGYTTVTSTNNSGVNSSFNETLMNQTNFGFNPAR